MQEPDHLRQAVTHALLILRNTPAPTPNNLVEAAALVASMMSNMGVILDPGELVRQLEAMITVQIGEPTVLDNRDTEHVAWLPTRRGQIKWGFWNRYDWYLRNEVGLDDRTIASVDGVTDKVLERLEDPARSGPWDRRGMVVGDVQSGKTGSYIGLMCKAADAGYHAIVILAGMHNNLRSQTQERVDLGFLGFDTERNLAYDNDNKRIGVGLLQQKDFSNLPSMALTSSRPLGDFKKATAEGLGVSQLGGMPTVFVVKKNKSVLQNLTHWLSDRVGDTAALIIDDEADNASVNTAAMPEPGEDWNEYDPTIINGLIRSVLMKFRRRAYVGYTATPFANIFIHPDADHLELGPDLFPRDFIINLPTPSIHVGPAEIFGLTADPRAGIDARQGLPVVREIPASEAQAFMPHRHKKDYTPAELPPSLRRAIRSFLLSCALRGCRGQESRHQTMLIHVTRFVDVQAGIRELVEREVKLLASLLRMEGAQHAALLAELKLLWDEDYTPTSTSVRDQWSDPLMTPVAWQDIKLQLSRAASRIEVSTINGQAGDVRRYKEAKDGCYLIAIGGDKLSRGLTLEGLTVSYFLRASHMYDTLMQMGRWFGYRPGYLDACRLFITRELSEWYQHIAAATIELRQDFDYMALTGAKPSEFGLRVRQHPAELEITSANKMRTGQPMQVSFADSLAETVVFWKVGDPASQPHPERTNLANIAACTAFLQGLGAPGAPARQDYFTWRDIGGASVVTLLRAYQNHPESRRSRPDLLADYIEAQIKAGELGKWTVCLAGVRANQSAAETSYAITPSLRGGLLLRSNVAPPNADCYSLSKHHLIAFVPVIRYLVQVWN